MTDLPSATDRPLQRVALLAWLALVLITWGHQYDDAFIHLRYAANLLAHGVLAYTPGLADHGASSPLTVALLAPLSPLGALAPKLLSTAATAAILLVLVRLRDARGVDAVALAAAVVAVCSPSAVRWLPNGMETSLAVLAALGLGLTARRTDPWVPVALFFAILLRVELLAVAGFLILAALLERRHRRGLLLLISAALATATLIALTGRLLPDTAIAKAQGPFDPALMARTATLVVRAHLAAPLLVLGSVVAWALGLRRMVDGVRAARIPDRGRRWAIVAALQGLVPALILVAVARGQVIQGVRYFVWLEAFTVAASFAFAHAWAGPVRAPPRRLPGARVLVALFVLELALLWPVFSGRAQTVRALHQQDWTDDIGAPCIAGEIGAFGYTSGCAVLDLFGLVNGEELARLPPTERHARIAREPVQLLFLSPAQFAALNAASGDAFRSWRPHGAFPFPNVSGAADVHHIYRPPR